MKKYEYLAIPILAPIVPELNKLGERGWMVVNVQKEVDGNFWYLLMREITEAASTPVDHDLKPIYVPRT